MERFVEVDEMRKGPWTEEEDAQLMDCVGVFGERRWDFIAKVSGLRRTGKSCRLRWVNCLDPSLKRGRLSTDEKNLVLELHALWGNRWSQIARILPGRTDNEIKNYWRTHIRKKTKKDVSDSCISSTSSVPSASALQGTAESSAIDPRQEMFKLPDLISNKKGTDGPFMVTGTDNEIKNYWRTYIRKKTKNDVSDNCISSTSSVSSASVLKGGAESSPIEPRQDMFTLHDLISNKRGRDDPFMVTSKDKEDWRGICYPMEQLWDDIAASELNELSFQEHINEVNYLTNCTTRPTSPLWDCYWDSLWKMND